MANLETENVPVVDKKEHGSAQPENDDSVGLMSARRVTGRFHRVIEPRSG